MDSSKEFILSINDGLIISTRELLTDYRKKILSDLYAPIIGTVSTNLYISLFNFVEKGEIESPVLTHKTLFSRLFINEVDEFLKARHLLEALGLLDVYLKEDKNEMIYIYQLKEVADPYDFLTDPILEELLKNNLGNDEFNRVVSELLVHRYDLENCQNITRFFDEEFQVSKAISDSKYHNYWVSSKNKGIKLKENYFDYEYLLILLDSLDLLDRKVIKSVEFYETVNRLSFMYGLNVEEMAEAIKSSITPKGELSYDVLNINVKYQYDQKNQIIKIRPVTVKTNSNDRLINVLENTPPKDIVENKYGTALTSSEVEMFEKLLSTTNLPLGVLNVLIIYVISSKNGEIPSYNYFLKIANSWIRGGIKTTLMALDKISGNLPKNTPTKQKPTKQTASWYNDYLEEEKKKMAIKNEEPQESLEELDEFFKGNTK